MEDQEGRTDLEGKRGSRGDRRIERARAGGSKERGREDREGEGGSRERGQDGGRDDREGEGGSRGCGWIEIKRGRKRE